MLVKLSNDYHNTTVTLRVPEHGCISKRQVRRAELTLCGMDDCSCSGTLGERPALEIGSDWWPTSYGGACLHFARADKPKSITP